MTLRAISWGVVVWVLVSPCGGQAVLPETFDHRGRDRARGPPTGADELKISAAGLHSGTVVVVLYRTGRGSDQRGQRSREVCALARNNVSR